jgi:RNA polymerase primary sigma factor
MEALKAYLDQIKNTPVLTKEEEIPLIKKAKNNNLEARRKVINSNLKLVINIAKHYAYFDLPLMDLIAEGNIGLMRAIDKFNPSKGFRFSTYAAWWIRQAITRALIDQGKTIRVPVYMSELINKYKKVKEHLRQTHKREPSNGEIAKRLKISVEKVSELDLWIQKKSSIEAPVGEDGESQLGDFLTTDEYADTGKEINLIFDKERVHQLLDSLDEREKQILDLRFGITADKPHTLASVAKELNISRERVRQIEKDTLNRLRKYAEEEQKREL